ncbi:MAG TPA: hypothetical protein VF092_04120 [Longimicrobium sp.]
MRRTSIFALTAISLAAPISLAAQDDLAARNEAFLRAVRDGDRERIAAFFPTRGDWTWVQAWENAPARKPSIHRFAAAETMRAIANDGPACMSFEQMSGEVGPVETVLSMVAQFNEGPWRRTRGTRFVPPASASRRPGASSAFVEWRREDGRWVVSTFGDAMYYRGPRLIGRERFYGGVRDSILPLPPTPVYAAAERWYVNNEPFYFEGRRYVKYGLPRTIDPALLRRIGRFGLMGIYAEKPRPGEDDAETVYIPVGPGEYQPYQAFGYFYHCGVFRRGNAALPSPRG